MTDPSSQHHFHDRVALDQIDRDIFTGWCHSGAPLRAYGGQIAAQSLAAAGRTVEQPDRRIHSLHGYFLRPGRTKDSITYLVERPRDGRSFSTRIVRAVQHGETIFMMTASFASSDDGPSHQFTAPEAPAPLDLPIGGPALAADLIAADERRALDYPATLIVDLREEDASVPVPLADGRYERLTWVRITEALPDDWLMQACALTYVSDLTMVRTALAPHLAEVTPTDLMLASIDHAMWFHAPVRVDQWLLFAQDSPAAGGGHGLARGLFFDESGRLVASVVQESLMRTRRS